eukprot:5241589-Prymnesium_polylepis.1
MRPGRLDRKVEIPLPNEVSATRRSGAFGPVGLGRVWMRGQCRVHAGRVEIMKIHGAPITKKGDIDYESVVKLADGFNAADLRNVCTEGGMFAIRAERDYVIEEDFMKAVRGDVDLTTCGRVARAIWGPLFGRQVVCTLLRCLRVQVRKVAENKKLEGKLEYSKV